MRHCAPDGRLNLRTWLDARSLGKSLENFRACPMGGEKGYKAMAEGEPNDNRKGRILLIVLGAIALTFIVAAISSNLSIWRQNDAIEAEQQVTENGG